VLGKFGWKRETRERIEETRAAIFLLINTTIEMGLVDNKRLK
jgi:hypothetical protein